MKIAFTGSHSTGKTTLLGEIAKKTNLKIYHIAEIARNIIKRGFPLSQDATVDSYINYVNEQLKAEFVAMESKYDLLISDRTILDAVAYSKVNKKLSRPFIPDYLIEMLERVWLLEKNFYDIYIYFPVEFPMVCDGVRPEDVQYQIDVGEQIKELLEFHRINYITICGSTEERYNSFLKIIKEVK